MWTLVQFALRSPDYRTAFELLAAVGFAPHRRPADGPGVAFPAAVVAVLFQEPSVVTRAVFDALDEAGLGPVAVAAVPVELGRAARGGGALALA